MSNPDPASLALDQIDVSDPTLYRDDVIGPYFERLRRKSPVHYCPASDYGAYWSLTKYEHIIEVNAADDIFSCDFVRL